MSLLRFSTACVIACMLGSSADATSLRVSPVRLDLNGGTATSTIRLWDSGSTPTNVQVRVYRWTKVNGRDRLDPTTDVVASPPVTKLAPGRENLIRVVRVAKKPISGTETYRLLIDELPDPKKRVAGQVNVVIRHSIPVRFSE